MIATITWTALPSVRPLICRPLKKEPGRNFHVRGRLDVG